MSSRGATWRGFHHQRFDQRIRSRKNQRNRLKSDKMHAGEVVDFPRWRFEKMRADCKRKVAHKTYGAAMAAKINTERECGKELWVYECPFLRFMAFDLPSLVKAW